MRRILSTTIVLVALGGIALVSNASAANWDSCADDLDRLRRAARDATDKANELKTKSDEFDNCKRYPDMYDLMKDRCRSKATYYQSALNDLGSELSTIDSRMRSVRSSCSFEVGAIGAPAYARPQPLDSGNQVCELYRSYKGKLPPNALLDACKKTMSEVECTKCLNSK